MICETLAISGTGRGRTVWGATLTGLIAAVVSGLVGETCLRAQPQPRSSKSRPAFEVASIRPSPVLNAGQESHIGIKVRGDRVDIGHWSIKQLVLKAYGLETYQVTGPDWINTARFDISGKIPDGSPRAQVPEMLKSLLVDRFGLVTHDEKRDVSGYDLVVAKGGPKMKPAVPDPEAAPGAETGVLDDLMGDGKSLGLKGLTSDNGNVRMEFAKLSMPAFARTLGSYLRQPVFDKTGLEGRYQAILEFSFSGSSAVASRQTDAREAGPASTVADPGDTSLFSTVSRLGLRLQRRKGPITILVVDHAEEVPAAN